MSRPAPWGELSLRIAAHPLFTEFSSQLAARRGRATRLPASAAAWVLDLIAEKRGSPLIVVVPHEADALEWLESLRLVTGETLGGYFATPSLSPYQEAEASLTVRSQEVTALADVLAGRLRALLVTPRALFRRLPDAGALTPISLRRGDEVDLEELARRLTALGYRRVDLVGEVGDFAVRGGVFDLFAAGDDEPLRLDLFGNEIESLRRFEVESQRSHDELREAAVLPLALFPEGPDDARRLAGALREAIGASGFEPGRETRDHLIDLAGGGHFPGWENLLPLLAPRTLTLAELVPDAIWVALDPLALSAEIAHHALRLREEFAARREHQRFALDPELLEHPEETVQALVSGAAAALVPLAAPGEALDFGVTSTDLYHGQLQRFPHEVAATHSRGERLLLVAPSERHAALSELLEGRDVALGANGVELVSGDVERGYRLPVAGVAIYGETQLLPRPLARSGRRGKGGRFGPFLATLRDLKVGDHVVHNDHGIGQFVALRSVGGPSGVNDAASSSLPASMRTLAGPATADNEVMEILYGGGKRLLVPLARLDLVQKYSGIEGIAPRLDQLGGSSWNKTKSKVRSGLRDMAEELLKLYAERQLARAPILAGSTDLERQFAAAFPYDETADQADAIVTVLEDLTQSKPMDRLLCGDVGFGKTEVAMRAAFRAVDAGYQVAVLAPTTILADQHLEVFTRRFDGFPVTIERLSRLRVGKDLKDLKARIASGKVDIALGTHRLLSKDIEFNRLGLVIVDEEQRFGVAQKERLKQLKKNVHVLAMSATPLPRTLQLSLAGVRDMVVIETPPKDRMAIETAVLPFSAELVREAIEFELGRGGQVFYVYNRVESIEQMAGVLRDLIPGLRITIGHGQLDERELYRRMHAFTAREFDVLLATTIIENGIDIPTVNTMIVHRADRFGLAQLYQLRGRVGRSRELGYCYLLVPPDVPLTDEARRRLEALREFTELGAGFRIAGRDLEIRGAGNLLGAQQSGHIAELGIETYLKMLEDTVRELKGETVEEGPSVALDLPLVMTIPKGYIADENLRMEIYRKLATAELPREELLAELTDRFGRPPKAVLGLLDLVDLKRTAESLRVQAISASAGQLIFRLRRDARIDVDRLIRYVSTRTGAAFSPTGVLTLELPPGQSVVEIARNVLAELAA
ncbi:MAG: transcription-repair coupling factor [Thermoanaerobaculia bacterium]